jgi:ADP-ribosyl-[dinitrogen reductase] hydrolase
MVMSTVQEQKTREEQRASRAHYRGCLLGGAIGDALGAPVEFDSLAAIRRKHGVYGVRHYLPAYGRDGGAITDDTQMTLFTAEGVIRADNRSRDRGLCDEVAVGYHALMRWLHTQGEPYDKLRMWERGWLVGVAGLRHRRAPGNTCLSSLQRRYEGQRPSPERPANRSKGCGAVMRMAPIGLCCSEPASAYEYGRQLGALTHGHPSGHIAAGVFAELIAELRLGRSLATSVATVIERHADDEGAEEVVAGLRAAVELADPTRAQPDTFADRVESLGAGWVAEEALSIAVCCALSAHDFVHGVRLAVNHSGDSDSTGAICGNILGLVDGSEGIERIDDTLVERLELREVITELADELWLRWGQGQSAEELRPYREAHGPVHDERFPPN